MTKKLVPFSMYPFSWGLVGKERDKAEANYSLEGYELEKRLLEICKDEHTEKEFTIKESEILFKYNKITQLEHLRVLANLINDENQKKLALLELDYKEKKISEQEYEKGTATLKGEPWVTVIRMDFGGVKSLEGSFELDWNEFFVDNLKKEGYVGPTDDNIVNQWFMEVCRNVAMEEFDGTGDFTADSAANLETVKRWNSEYIGTTHKGYK